MLIINYKFNKLKKRSDLFSFFSNIFVLTFRYYTDTIMLVIYYCYQIKKKVIKVCCSKKLFKLGSRRHP